MVGKKKVGFRREELTWSLTYLHCTCIKMWAEDEHTIADLRALILSIIHNTSWTHGGHHAEQRRSPSLAEYWERKREEATICFGMINVSAQMSFAGNRKWKYEFVLSSVLRLESGAKTTLFTNLACQRPILGKTGRARSNSNCYPVVLYLTCLKGRNFTGNQAPFIG